MNILETYVTNIQSVKQVPNLSFILYKIICDTDCYGVKKTNTTIHVTEHDYQSIKEKGYYMT